MHTGALMAARQALGQYLICARGWQRVLIAGGVIAGGALLVAAGIATGHIVMAVVGGLLLLASRQRLRPGPARPAGDAVRSVRNNGADGVVDTHYGYQTRGGGRWRRSSLRPKTSTRR